ncbi:Patatin [Gluconacetobacter diazotrophicus PA1 5]|uniref:Patatin-like phospholipase family protein n=2 Tax=Gluconacetobacter diazotrophicus TaxID=33996 RepID=A0A7W4FEB4_GLUDI|nr:patatin-like phospholipase family protein [Gluconacetobacter diazotrophicus]ACI50858.1 Patatin [Gluconacetobacter diazotrophicus PA1 5]MBB2156206.1 patatin-like phospholipase family protein [Gluconacetobacter diazotrophicus]TWB08688.1 NTE family protein [Gluconacetobacter diazotrophicus]CAP54893.1 putative patatin-like phospholipase [Gluconacetobacter diazotrophicus PA1 5]
MAPESCRPIDAREGRIGLVLQGGGALGAYQAGVYQELHEAGLEPDWISGVSIGSINAALIAGNPPELRVARLRQFWERVTSRQVWLGDTPAGDSIRKMHNAWSSFMTSTFGQPGFFRPRLANPWLAGRDSHAATSYYDSTPLRDTLESLVDFERLNDSGVRLACGAVNVGSGNFIYFDTVCTRLTIDHVMASAALPPAMPMVRIGQDYYWDGGMVSNTPLQHLLDHVERDSMLVFQVDLFSARGPVPRDMFDVQARTKDIQYSSRTRLITDHYRALHRQNLQIRALLDRIPEADRTDEDRALRRQLSALPAITILQLIYQEEAYEGQTRDFEFSAASMEEHWDAGARDTRMTLSHPDWLRPAPDDAGVIVHDAHRPDR